MKRWVTPHVPSIFASPGGHQTELGKPLLSRQGNQRVKRAPVRAPGAGGWGGAGVGEGGSGLPAMWSPAHALSGCLGGGIGGPEIAGLSLVLGIETQSKQCGESGLSSMATTPRGLEAAVRAPFSSRVS